MIEILLLIPTSAIFILILVVVIRSAIVGFTLLGTSPINVFYFILAKALALVNFTYLFLRGFKINNFILIEPSSWTDIIALVLLLIGTILSFIAMIK